MKKQIQIKRNKPTKSNYRVLYAKTGRKRKLHAATTAASSRHAGLGADVPSIGVGKALFVILVLHVLAVAAIYIHSVFPKDETPSANKGQASSPVDKAAVIIPAEAKAQKPEVKKKPSPSVPLQEPSAMGRYIAVTGDTYPRIAKNHNVSVRALRALNNDRALRPGVVLDLPAQLSARPVDPTPLAPAKPASQAKPKAQLVNPSAPKAKVETMKQAAPVKEAEVATVAKAVEVVESTPKPKNDVSKAPKAILVEDEVAQPVAAEIGVKYSGETYKIQRGDTLWGIASRFKVGRDDLLELNGIKDANKLYAGRTIKIPAQ